MEARPLAKHEVVKHIGAIHVSNELSLLERKVSNVLLKNAWEHLSDREIHTISIRDLADMVGFDSKDVEKIKEALRALRSTEIQWNILGQDRKNSVWGVSGILASVQIHEGEGICQYAYPPHLRNILRNPNIFARINLLIQRQFGSKYALGLWEYASGELALSGTESISEQECLTEWVTIEMFRDLLGSNNPTYDEFKIFNRDVLKPAISEVNRVSNLEIRDTEYRREKRKITALRFSILPKGTYQLPFDFPIPEALENEPIARLPAGASDEKAELIRRMVEVGVSEKVAQGTARAFGVDRITENLDWAVRQIESGRDIRNPAAFAVSAIRGDWVQPERVKRKKTRDIEQTVRDRKELEALVSKIEGDFWLARVDWVEAIRAGFSDDERAAFERRMVEKNVFVTEERWERYRTGGIEDRAIRSLFYKLAFDELLSTEQRDMLRFAEGRGASADVIEAIRKKPK